MHSALSTLFLSNLRYNREVGTSQCSCSVCRLQHAHFSVASFLYGPIDFGRDCLVYPNASKKIG